MSYDSDILLWSEQQASLLRRAARGERVNGLDWENLIEEIESVGRSELRAVESQLKVALIYLLLAAHARRREPVAHWLAEARAALTSASRFYLPSMAQRITLDHAWQDAWEFAADKLAHDEVRLPDRAPDLPFGLLDLVGEKRDIPALLACLTA